MVDPGSVLVNVGAVILTIQKYSIRRKVSDSVQSGDRGASKASKGNAIVSHLVSFDIGVGNLSLDLIAVFASA
jgi:hypothetical protein